MNRADKIFIGILIIIVCGLYVPSLWTSIMNQGKVKEVVVRFKDQEILRKPLNEDATYEVDGSQGLVNIEVKNQEVRVEKESSPYHLCSIQGWVSESNRPIVCLPNNIVVMVEAGESDVDVVIQ